MPALNTRVFELAEQEMVLKSRLRRLLNEVTETRNALNDVSMAAYASVQGKILYLQSAEVHAAVHAVADIAIRYAYPPSDELFEKLISFFCQYDRTRSEQVESLKSQLIEALKWSVKPTPTDPPSTSGA